MTVNVCILIFSIELVSILKCYVFLGSKAMVHKMGSAFHLGALMDFQGTGKGFRGMQEVVIAWLTRCSINLYLCLCSFSVKL